MTKDTLYSGELPQSLRIMVVDDEFNILQRNMSALQEALSVDVGQLYIYSVNDVISLINSALSQQPEIIVLDDSYRYNSQLWHPTEEGLESISNFYGVNFNAIRKHYRGGWSVSGEMPDDLYFPNSTHFALLLRFFGFNDKVVVSSGEPPDFEYIERERSNLNKHLINFSVNPINQTIINGVIVKGFRNEEQYWATSAGIYGWDYQRMENTKYPQALKALISNI